MTAHSPIRFRSASSAVSVCVGLALLTILALDLLVASEVHGSTTHDPSSIPYAHRLLNNVTFVVFDTETTGLDPHRDRIVELAAVKYRNGEITDKKAWLINPGRKIPYYVQKVHGISNAMVRDRPRFQDIYPEFSEYIDDAVLVAHNANFDISFLKSELQRTPYGLPRNKVLDSLKLVRTWYPGLKSYSLSAVVRHAGIEGNAFHRALNDSVYVARILDRGVQNKPSDARLRDIYADCDGPLEF